MSAVEAPVTSKIAEEASQPLLACPPVALRGKMSADGYLPENWAWRDHLTEAHPLGRTDSAGEVKLAGKDPMSIPLDLLTASGHPPRRTISLVGAMSGAMELDYGDIREYRDIRGACLHCAGDVAEVRRCAIMNCPFWPTAWGVTHIIRDAEVIHLWYTPKAKHLRRLLP